jgi:hypothetical protein
MRLFNISIIQFREFHFDIPHYTILSYIWENEEVIFVKLGYPKLKRRLDFRKSNTAASRRLQIILNRFELISALSINGAAPSSRRLLI